MTSRSASMSIHLQSSGGEIPRGLQRIRLPPDLPIPTFFDLYGREYFTERELLVVAQTETLEAVENAAKTGRIGDGKIFVSNLEETIRIRTGETGQDAI